MESLAVQLFPKIGELRDAISLVPHLLADDGTIMGEGQKMRKSFGAILKQQKLAEQRAAERVPRRRRNSYRREMLAVRRCDVFWRDRHKEGAVRTEN